MATSVLTIVLLLAGTLLCDRMVRPRPCSRVHWRSAAGLWLTVSMMIALFGGFLALCGNIPVALALALATLALLVLVSNAKNAVLGEPLLFSDLALIGSVFRHPQFYLSAIALWQRVLVALAAVALLAVLSWTFVPAPWPHVAGALLLLSSLAVLTVLVRSASIRELAPIPDAAIDVRRHGLLATLLLYWLRWRASRDPDPCVDVSRQPGASDAAEPELVVVVQCESFADPVALFADSRALPGLAAARQAARLWGRLQVSGFGAYTMRTEYGVLFGRSEDQLGFRRYDPFLTALGETSYALPARLVGAGWRSLFVHPHDMRFYGRDRIMPAGGFAELIGEDGFAAATDGRYVSDAAVTERILALAAQAMSPTMIYAVTIENHGPWAASATSGQGGTSDGYLRLVRNSDAMLAGLMDGLAALCRPTLLVFFGDHRPSIPGIVSPGGARDTPYVMVRFDAAGKIVPGDHREADLTPAQLHHAILDAILGECTRG